MDDAQNDLSPKSQNEYIKLLGDNVFNMATEEVNESLMWSVFADTTPDVSHRDQLVVVARYVGPGSGEPTECLVDINGKTGDGQAQGIIASVDQKSHDKDGIVFQYDMTIRHLCQVYSKRVRQ